jgi:hypothetical protein
VTNEYAPGACEGQLDQIVGRERAEHENVDDVEEHSISVRQLAPSNLKNEERETADRERQQRRIRATSPPFNAGCHVIRHASEHPRGAPATAVMHGQIDGVSPAHVLRPSRTSFMSRGQDEGPLWRLPSGRVGRSGCSSGSDYATDLRAGPLTAALGGHAISV